MLMNSVVQAMENGLLPDPAVRFGIRRLCRDRLKSLTGPSLEEEQARANAYSDTLKKSPIAVHTKEANDQHYELPPEFFTLVLGRNRKYSSAFWSEDCKDLDSAEDEALATTIERAELKDGMNILELGCGWGSLTFAMAKKFPNAKITALSNSTPQREWIEKEALALGIQNIRVVTRNIATVLDLTAEFGQFDRVVSVEMFEHLRNYEALFTRIASWLKDDGKLFVHIFTHRQHSYLFETEGEDNWLGKYFFTGGQMPAHHLFAHFQRDLLLTNQWAWSGTHYAKTSEAWLEKIDENRDRVLQIFEKVYGSEEAFVWLQRWRVFFMSCAELFQYQNGSEWGVSHYLFSKRRE